MIQINPERGSLLSSSNGTLSEQDYVTNNSSFDETLSIISLYGKLYAPSQIGDTESIISGAMVRIEFI